MRKLNLFRSSREILAKICQFVRPDVVVPNAKFENRGDHIGTCRCRQEKEKTGTLRGIQHQLPSHSNGYILSGLGIIQLEAKHQSV